MVAPIVRSHRVGDRVPVACVVRWKNARLWTNWIAMPWADVGLAIVCRVLLIHAAPSRCVKPSSMVAKKVSWKQIANNAADQLGAPLAKTVTACWTIPRLTTPLALAVCPTDDARNTTCVTVLNLGGNSSVNCNHPTATPIWLPVKRSPSNATPSLLVAFPTNHVALCPRISA